VRWPMLPGCAHARHIGGRSSTAEQLHPPIRKVVGCMCSKMWPAKKNMQALLACRTNSTGMRCSVGGAPEAPRPTCYRKA
jgi:hypothetical protein